MSKYDKLWKYVKDDNKEKYELGFDEIKDILGFEIDHSFLKYKKELEDFGYKVVKIKLKEKSVLIEKVS
ncbi:MAG: hypothetical protein Q4C44_01765 [bacterium]|nr:hypothetical protein [bacterium]